jgi:hypothetical protein
MNRIAGKSRRANYRLRLSPPEKHLLVVSKSPPAFAAMRREVFQAGHLEEDGLCISQHLRGHEKPQRTLTIPAVSL